MAAPFPKDREQEVCDLYASKETSEIAGLFGIHPNTVLNILTRNGVSKRDARLPKYGIDETYFDTIDTEEKAYFLGMMGSDGYVETDGRGVALSLSGAEDKVVLERMKEALRYEGQIRPKKLKYPNAKPHFRLAFDNAKIRSDLIRHGIVPQKSLVYQFNESIPSPLFRHYVRGYFDGDGSVSIKKDGSPLVGVTSSPDFIRRLAHILNETLDLSPTIEDRKNAHGIRLGGLFVCFMFLDWIYRDATIFLPRKEAKYRECQRLVRHKLGHVEECYNLLSHEKTMKHAARCAELLDIRFNPLSCHGLSLSKKVQHDIVETYRIEPNARKIARNLGLSSGVIRRVLSHNEENLR